MQWRRRRPFKLQSNQGHPTTIFAQNYIYQVHLSCVLIAFKPTGKIAAIFYTLTAIIIIHMYIRTKLITFVCSITHRYITMKKKNIIIFINNSYHRPPHHCNPINMKKKGKTEIYNEIPRPTQTSKQFG